MDITLKRVIAYLIDVLIVSLITSLLTSISFLNPYYDKYQETYNAYTEIMNEESVDNDKIIELNYDLYKYRIYNSSISIGTLLLYFGVVAYFNKGQTIGKKIMKLKVTSNKDKKLNVGNYLLRIFILNNMIFSIWVAISVYIFDSTTFYYVVYVTSLVESLVLMINLLMITLRKDNRGIHDLLAGTIVVPTEVIMPIDEEKVSIKEKTRRKNKKE